LARKRQWLAAHRPAQSLRANFNESEKSSRLWTLFGQNRVAYPLWLRQDTKGPAMDSTGSGFRILHRHEPFTGGDPKIVIFRLDPATLDFLEISGKPERLLGFPVAEWYRPHFWSDRIHPEDTKAVHAFFEAWAEAPRDEQLEYRAIGAAGQTVWLHQVIAVDDDAHSARVVRGVLIDVTERVARETEVEKALFLKAELFRVVTEELAPPVRAISVFSELLERHLAARRDHVGSDYALGLRDALLRLDGLLAQLVRIAQPAGMSVGEMSTRLAAMRRNSEEG
jgi:PAS domain-containing protein